jgi:multidrug resistance efflux pump
MLTKQVEDAQELRKQLSETVSDLQRQLKNEREENKKSKKRSIAAFWKNVINNYRELWYSEASSLYHLTRVQLLSAVQQLYSVPVWSWYRIQLLESETKRNGSKKLSDAEANNAADTVDTLTQEVAMLKRDLLTAERIAKQSEVFATLFGSLWSID